NLEAGVSESLTTRLRPNGTAGLTKTTETRTMATSLNKAVDPIDALQPSCRESAAHALTIVRDGVITGEGPTTRGRVHVSRALDAADAAWCARILTTRQLDNEPVSRAEAAARFEIN